MFVTNCIVEKRCLPNWDESDDLGVAESDSRFQSQGIEDGMFFHFRTDMFDIRVVSVEDAEINRSELACLQPHVRNLRLLMAP